MNQFSMSGKTAVVTGAASGIGLATATRLAAAGADVVLADINDASAQASALNGRYVKADISDERSVKRLFDVTAVNGPFHVLVQAAGVMTESVLAEVRLDDFEHVTRINVHGVLLGLKHAPAHMTSGGAIVNIASLAASVGLPGYGAYSATKAAVLALTGSLPSNTGRPESGSTVFVRVRWTPRCSMPS